MKNVRAPADAPPPPHRAGLLGRIAGLPRGAIAAAASVLSRTRLWPNLESERDDEDLWLLLIASDPNGIWYPWHADYRRPQIDDPHDAA